MEKVFTLVLERLEEACQATQETEHRNTSRMLLWNMVFPDNPVRLTTNPVELLTRVLRSYLRDRKTDRFCFEVATIFLDLPNEFNHLVEYMPFPIPVAMRHAYNTLYEAFDPPSRSKVRTLLREAEHNLRQDQFCMVKDIIRQLATGGLDFEGYARLIEDHTSTRILDLFLEVLPARARLHLALEKDRPVPRLSIDFAHIAMPFEFVQALSDIDGPEILKELLEIPTS